MLNKLYLFFVCLILGLSIPVYAADYYVSSLTGNDANNGSQEQPWQTINRVNQETFPENSKILFKRGEVFRGEISSFKFQTNLHFDAYGEGQNPVISGSVQITNWQPTTHSALPANVYEADVSAFIVPNKKGIENTIQHLFVNGELMTIARYPNVNSPADTNWLKVGAGAGSDSFTDPALVNYPKPDGYWNNAILRIRTYSWYYKVFKITGYSATNGQITAKGLGGQLPEWGYFLDDKLEELDHPGEWFYDKNTKKVYFYPRNNQDPNTLSIEGSTYKTGLSIVWHEDNSRVENLTFRHFTQEGVNINTSDNVTVRQCHFEYNSKAVSVWKSANVQVSYNTLNNQMTTGIGLNAPNDFDVQNSVVEKNEINNTGLFPLYCARYEGICYGIGISAFGKSQIIRQNTVNKTGWIGINLKGGGHHHIENNVVKNALWLLNDGGAVGIGSDGNVIKGNFLVETIGNVDESNGCGSTNSTPCSHHPTYGMGIASDSKFEGNVIENNTIANNLDMGIRLNSFINSVVRNNTVYNNDPQIVVQDKKGKSSGNIIEGNIMYSLTPDQRGLVLTGTAEHGSFNNKIYCNPYRKSVVIKNNNHYSLTRLKTNFPNYEPNTVDCDIHLQPYNIVNVVGENLITKNALQIALQATKSTQSTTNRFTLQKDQFYRLKFNLVGNGLGSLRVRVNSTPTGGKWEQLQSSIFAYDFVNKENEFVFSVSKDITEGLLVFSSIKEGEASADALALDNITLEAVEAIPNNPQQQSVLFTNPTAVEKNISLADTVYTDLENRKLSGNLVLAPFSSQILIYVSGKRPPKLGNLQERPLTLKLDEKTVNISWEAEPEAEGYRLYYAPYPYTGADTIKNFDMKAQKQFSIELPSGSAFYVAIKSYNKLGESEFSNIESFIIP